MSVGVRTANADLVEVFGAEFVQAGRRVDVMDMPSRVALLLSAMIAALGLTVAVWTMIDGAFDALVEAVARAQDERCWKEGARTLWMVGGCR